MTSYETEDDEDDELVYESELFLSQPAATANLYLLQYPLRTNFVPVGTERPIQGVSIRPRHGRVEVRLGMLGATENGVDQDEDVNMMDPGATLKNIGKTQVLRSQPATVRPHANYTVSYVVDGALVVIPLKSILQLRPSFDYIDRTVIAIANAKHQQQQQNNNNNNNNTLSVSEPTTVNVAIRKRESEKSAARRRSSHISQVKREAEEAWIPLDYITVSNCDELFDFKLFNPVSVRQRLTKSEIVPANVVKLEPSPSDPTSCSYLDLFEAHTRTSAAGYGGGINNAKNISLEPPSIKSYLAMTPSLAITTFVAHARLVKFADVLNITNEHVDTKDILSALQSAAFLLRGCWVANKFPVSNASKKREARKLHEKLNAARHLILNMFRYNRQITFEKIPQQVRYFLTPHRIAAILAEVAVNLPDKPGMWEFKLDDDLQFIDLFEKSLVKDQTLDWNKRVTHASKVMTENAITHTKHNKTLPKSSPKAARPNRGGAKSSKSKHT